MELRCATVHVAHVSNDSVCSLTKRLFHLKIVLFCESAFVSPENHTFFSKKNDNVDPLMFG